ncbi:MAG: MFS transporter [Verrucomicrobiota bacterium]
MSSSQHIPTREKIAFGLGDTAANLTWRSLMVFLPFFYTDVFGISAAAVGTLLLVSRYFDGISDFIIGLLADRSNSRWGKFRPWILFTAVPFGVLTVLTFTTPDFGMTGKLIYAYLTYNLLLLTFTANNVPYSALTGVMSSDPNQRTILTSYRFFGAFLGAIITQGLNAYLVEALGGGDNVSGYQRTMILFAVLSIVLFFITFIGTTERVQPVAPPKVDWKKGLAEDIKNLVGNRPWLILFGVGLSFVTLTTLKQGATLYYFKWFVGNVPLSAAFLVFGTLGAMIGAALTGILVTRYGKKRVMNVAFIVAGLSSAPLYFAGPDNLVLIFGLSFITEFATGPIVVLFFAMLADAADFSEWKTGRRATGLFYSAGTLAIKFGGGIGGAATGWTLTLTGYVPNVAQTEEALMGIRLVMSWLPALACVIGLLVFSFYPLDQAKLFEIKRDLDARHDADGRTSAPSPAT